MRVLFLSDLLFTKHERDMIARLGIGLADEGTRVTWSVPLSIAPAVSASLLFPVIPHQEPRLGLTLKARAARLHDAARVTLGGEPDIVHVFGGGAARLAAEIARGSSAVPAYELWRPHLEPVVRLSINRAIGPASREPGSRRVPLIVVPSAAAQARANQAFPDAVVRRIPWGVHTSREERHGSFDAICLLLMGPGRDARAWQSAFLSAIRAMRADQRVHLFADAAATARHRVWKAARDAGVLDRLSLVENPESQRDLALHADILIYPDAKGETRTLLLEAMASRVAIIAAADPLAESLIDGVTARLVAEAAEPLWSEAITHLIADTDARHALIASAAEYAQKNHRATRQIVSLTDAYEWVAGDPVRIGPDSPSILGPADP
jgi:glycosyltransferase involved in cell wall biosynthesis